VYGLADSCHTELRERGHWKDAKGLNIVEKLR